MPHERGPRSEKSGTVTPAMRRGLARCVWGMGKIYAKSRPPSPSRSASVPPSMLPRIWPGRPYPLGASYDGGGVNFAIFSEHAVKVELCLFDRATGAREREAITLPEVTSHVFHGYVPGL